MRLTQVRIGGKINEDKEETSILDACDFDFVVKTEERMVLRMTKDVLEGIASTLKEKWLSREIEQDELTHQIKTLVAEVKNDSKKFVCWKEFLRVNVAMKEEDMKYRENCFARFSYAVSFLSLLITIIAFFISVGGNLPTAYIYVLVGIIVVVSGSIFIYGNIKLKYSVRENVFNKLLLFYVEEA